MKLHEINAIEFKVYGAIISDIQKSNKKLPMIKKITSSTNKSNELWMFESEVMLEPIEGVGVVFIETDKGLKMYLFDKVITINKNRWFCVVPYQCRFTYKIGFEKEKQVKKLKEVLTATGIHQRINVDSIYTVLYQEKAKHFNFKGESHPYWEMTYMDKGSMICTVDKEEILLKQGDLIFFAPNQFHKQRAADHHPLSFVTISFNLNFDDVNLFQNKVIKTDMAINRYIKQILSEERMDLPYSDEAMIATLTNLFIITIRLAKEARTVSKIRSTLSINTSNDLITNCVNYIDENLAYDLTLDVLSQNLCISASYLSKLFKRELGKGPGEYIKERRLHKAKLLIQSGTYSITQISDMMGYCSVTYLSTEFKNMYGVSPREYSKSIFL